MFRQIFTTVRGKCGVCLCERTRGLKQTEKLARLSLGSSSLHDQHLHSRSIGLSALLEFVKRSLQKIIFFSAVINPRRWMLFFNFLTYLPLIPFCPYFNKYIVLFIVLYIFPAAMWGHFWDHRKPWAYWTAQCKLSECAYLLTERLSRWETWLLPYSALKEQSLEQPPTWHTPYVSFGLVTSLVSCV